MTIFLVLGMYYAYILRSLKSGRYYIGSCEVLDTRLANHNSGKVVATRNKGPWRVVYSETFSTRKEAVRREAYIKRMKSKVYIESLLPNGGSESYRGGRHVPI